jgi:biopolymer transport protein ExbD
MADMNLSEHGGAIKGLSSKKRKKLSTRIDLTPMVDLGFLLITFFMYTTTMSKPKTMEINMPFKDPKQPLSVTRLKHSSAMTILLSQQNRVYYHFGLADDPTKPPDLKLTYFSPSEGIRDVIVAQGRRLEELRKQGFLRTNDKLSILIKPDLNSTYEDLVNILDEMSINAIEVYAIVDISPMEQEFINDTKVDILPSAIP